MKIKTSSSIGVHSVHRQHPPSPPAWGASFWDSGVEDGDTLSIDEPVLRAKPREPRNHLCRLAHESGLEAENDQKLFFIPFVWFGFFWSISQ